MWDFFETVRHRHSIRKYQTNRQVEAEKIHAILEMACAAPSAGDLQAYKIVVLSKQEDRIAIQQRAHNQTFISDAPVCLVFCSDPQRSAEKYGPRGEHLYAIQDATIAAAYAQLAAVAAGLASTWVGNFDEAEVKNYLDLDKNLTPIALIIIGYPAELPEPTTRRRLDDVVKYR